MKPDRGGIIHPRRNSLGFFTLALQTGRTGGEEHRIRERLCDKGTDHGLPRGSVQFESIRNEDKMGLGSVPGSRPHCPRQPAIGLLYSIAEHILVGP